MHGAGVVGACGDRRSRGLFGGRRGRRIGTPCRGRWSRRIRDASRPPGRVGWKGRAIREGKSEGKRDQEVSAGNHGAPEKEEKRWSRGPRRRRTSGGLDAKREEFPRVVQRIRRGAAVWASKVPGGSRAAVEFPNSSGARVEGRSKSWRLETKSRRGLGSGRNPDRVLHPTRRRSSTRRGSRS